MITLSPVALSGTSLVANQLSVQATIKEGLCRTCCIGGMVGIQSSVTYTNGTPVLNGGTVFVPITATVAITIPGKCCKVDTRVYTEQFTVAFQNRTAVPTSVTIKSVGKIDYPTDIHCCKAKTYTIQDSLEILIA